MIKIIFQSSFWLCAFQTWFCSTVLILPALEAVVVQVHITVWPLALHLHVMMPLWAAEYFWKPFLLPMARNNLLHTKVIVTLITMSHWMQTKGILISTSSYLDPRDASFVPPPSNTRGNVTQGKSNWKETVIWTACRWGPTKGELHWLLSKSTPEFPFHLKSFLDWYHSHLLCSYMICELPGQNSLHSNPFE